MEKGKVGAGATHRQHASNRITSPREKKSAARRASTFAHVPFLLERAAAEVELAQHVHGERLKEIAAHFERAAQLYASRGATIDAAELLELRKTPLEQ